LGLRESFVGRPIGLGIVHVRVPYRHVGKKARKEFGDPVALD